MLRADLHGTKLLHKDIIKISGVFLKECNSESKDATGPIAINQQIWKFGLALGLRQIAPGIVPAEGSQAGGGPLRLQIWQALSSAAAGRAAAEPPPAMPSD